MSSPPIAFRPMCSADLPLIHDWLQRPHVARWWPPPATFDLLVGEFMPMLNGEEQVSPYIVLVDDAPIGYIQSYVAMGSGGGWWLDERDPGTRGIDQYLANAHDLGKGLGTRVVRSFVRKLFDDPDVTRVQVDPSPDNARAIRCYEKVGFRASGEIDTPDGRALLMRIARDDVTVD